MNVHKATDWRQHYGGKTWKSYSRCRFGECLDKHWNNSPIIVAVIHNHSSGWVPTFTSLGNVFTWNHQWMKPFTDGSNGSSYFTSYLVRALKRSKAAHKLGPSPSWIMVTTNSIVPFWRWPIPVAEDPFSFLVWLYPTIVPFTRQIVVHRWA